MSPNESGLVAVIDDDASNLSALWRLLVGHRYRVKTFSTAEELLQGPDLDLVHCVLAGINLGDGMSGLELGETLLASGRPLPLILMTGSADDEMRRRARELGCVAVLDKPFSSEQLFDALSRANIPGGS